ncbi:MAG: aldo/keto reductase [Pyrinomonadaceae bacterium]|nr:aldo/keto reductase [Pyrinomonadaceae bacterium]
MNSANSEGTEKFKNRFSDSAEGHFRQVQGLTVSSIGIGTYLGNWDAATDENYTNSIVKFVESGGNVIDTAANYRFQRSERNIGIALKKLAEKGFGREELLICTKGGFLPFDNQPPTNTQKYYEETFVKTEIATFEDLVANCHCMTPKYLQSQIDQSLKNMDLDCLDVFYIHNPETQLSEIDKIEFEARLANAFERLEENRSAGKIKFYGVATWNGFRLQPHEQNYHSLEKIWRIAEKIGGENHGFRFIQLPFNLAMPEALLSQNQQFSGQVFSTIEVAQNLGVSVMISGSILQGKLSANLPQNIREKLGNLESGAITGLQFVRSTPGVTTALTGMSKTAHVEENMKLTKIPVATTEQYESLFS